MGTEHKEYDIRVQTLAKWIKESNYTVVFTGAGMSTESGIPDFRSSSGLWKGLDPMKVACIDALIENYDEFHEFYKTRVENLDDCKPHRGYDILAKWENDGLIDCIVTQNVDGFHQTSGNKKVHKLHGSINTFRCSHCDEAANKEDFMDKKHCVKCDGTLRPNVVLFGEALPQDELNNAIREMKKAELVIVIGTSLLVYPVNTLPSMTMGKKVYINKGIIVESSFDLNLDGMAGQILQDIDDNINA